MQLITILLLCFLALGVILGWSVTVGWRLLRRLGTTYILTINPMTEKWQEEWRRPKGELLRVGKGDDTGQVPLGQGKMYSHERSGKKLALIDGHAALPLTLSKEESRLCVPNGKDIEVNCRDQTVKQLLEAEGMDLRTLVVICLIGVVVILAMVVYLIVKLGAVAAGVSHAGA